MTTILWDTNRAYTGSFLNILNDKPNWTQIPYGTITHTFLGDTIIENDNFAYCSFLNNPDAPVLVPKLSNGKTASVVAYKVYDSGTRSFAGHHLNTNILLNTSNEIIVELIDLAGTGSVGTPISGKYRITNNSWLEITKATITSPTVNMNQQGIHQKGRTAGFIYTAVTKDRILDVKKHSLTEENIHPTQGSIGVMQFHRSSASMLEGDFMWIFTFSPGTENNALTYANINADPYYEIGCSGCKPCIGAIYSAIETKTFLGVLNNIDNWKREDINQAVTLGQIYTSNFIVPYSGIWRMVGVYSDNTWSIMNSQEMSINKNERFNYVCQKTGTLEYLMMYLYNRTLNTEYGVTTPIDVYNAVIECPQPICTINLSLN